MRESKVGHVTKGRVSHMAEEGLAYDRRQGVTHERRRGLAHDRLQGLTDLTGSRMTRPHSLGKQIQIKVVNRPVFPSVSAASVGYLPRCLIST